MLLATEYQDLALPVLRSSIEHVGKDNCDAMVVFANLVAACALGSRKPAQSISTITTILGGFLSGLICVVFSQHSTRSG